MRAARARQSPGIFASRGAAGERLDELVLGRRGRAQLRHLAEREVEREVGGEALPWPASRRWTSVSLSSCAAHQRQAGEIGLGVGGGLHRVGGIEEVGQAEIDAVLLGDRIRPLRRAGQAEALGADHLQVEVVEHDLAVDLRLRREAWRDRPRRCGARSRLGARRGPSRSRAKLLSSSLPRRSALAPVSSPSAVANSGELRSVSAKTASKAAVSLASPGAAGAAGRRRVPPASASAAADAPEARKSRRSMREILFRCRADTIVCAASASHIVGRVRPASTLRHGKANLPIPI